jgi:hypothetical protein
MQTVVETPSYLKAATVFFSEVEREGIVVMVAAELKMWRGNLRYLRIS